MNGKHEIELCKTCVKQKKGERAHSPFSYPKQPLKMILQRVRVER